MLQSNPVDDGHPGKDAVKIIGIALRHRQRLATAFRRSHEIQLGRRVAVGAHHQGDGGVPHPLVGPIRKILERLVVERKHLRRLARLGLVAGIRAVSDEAARQWRSHAKRIGRRQSEAGDQHAVEAATAILQRAAVPLHREVHLEFDRRRLRIGRRDLAEHLAEFRIGRGNARRRRRSSFGDRKRCRRDDRGGLDPHNVVGRSDKVAAGRGRIAGHLRGHRIRSKERSSRDQHRQQNARAQIEPEALHRFPRTIVSCEPRSPAGRQVYNGARRCERQSK